MIYYSGRTWKFDAKKRSRSDGKKGEVKRSPSRRDEARQEKRRIRKKSRGRNDGRKKMWREAEKGSRAEKTETERVQGWNNNPLLFPITVSIIESMRDAIIGSTCWNNTGLPDTPRQFFHPPLLLASFNYPIPTSSVSDFRSSVQPARFSRLRFNNIPAELNSKETTRFRRMWKREGGRRRKPTTHPVGETG